MLVKAKTYILIGTIVYCLFLGWYVRTGRGLLNKSWHPSDIYNQVGDIPITTAAAPSAEKVFEAQTTVPVKSAVQSRRARTMAIRKATNASTPKSTPRRNKSILSKRAITAVGEGLHTISNAKFRSFGAWGLINPVQQNYNKRRHAQKENIEHSSTMYLPTMGATPTQTIIDMQMSSQSTGAK